MRTGTSCLTTSTTATVVGGGGAAANPLLQAKGKTARSDSAAARAAPRSAALVVVCIAQRPATVAPLTTSVRPEWDRTGARWLRDFPAAVAVTGFSSRSSCVDRDARQHSRPERHHRPGDELEQRRIPRADERRDLGGEKAPAGAHRRSLADAEPAEHLRLEMRQHPEIV